MASKYPVTPKGEFLWAHITAPDTAYKEEGEYHVKVILRGNEGENLKNAVDAQFDNWLSSQKSTGGRKFLPYKENQADDGSSDGYQFHFKMKASGVNSKTGEKFTQRPIVVGPDRKPIPSDIRIANGSLGKVAYEFAPYNTKGSIGVQLRLRGVQVLELIEYNEGGSDDNIFDEEVGYELNVSSSEDKEAEDTFPEEAAEDEDF